MRKLIILWVVFYLLIFCFVSNIEASYCVLECSNKVVLEENRMHEAQSVASISKVMSAIIVIENSDLNDYVVINDIIDSVDGSSVYLKKGQVYSVRTLLYGLLLQSGNDAAVSLAYYIGGGSIDNFVHLMNEKARSLSLVHTKFTNPSGLDDDEGNYSTAYDMSIIMCEALKYPVLKDIMQTRQYKNEFGNTYLNKNKLLKNYKYTIGGKTGFTKKAGRTLVSAANNGFDVAITTLHHADDFAFHKKRYEDIFEKYQGYLIIKKGFYKYKQYTFNVDEDVYLIDEQFDEALLKAEISASEVKITYNSENFPIRITYQLKEVK